MRREDGAHQGEEKRKLISQITELLIFYPLPSRASPTWAVLHPDTDEWSDAAGVSSECVKSGHSSHSVTCISEDTQEQERGD